MCARVGVGGEHCEEGVSGRVVWLGFLARVFLLVHMRMGPTERDEIDHYFTSPEPCYLPGQ